MDSTSPLIQLNFLQQLMLRWSQYIAYNAVHVVHVKGNPNITRWQAATLQTIHKIGMGYPQFHNPNTVHFLPLTDLIIATPTIDLSTYVNQELNRPFLIDEFPLRFFVIGCEDDTHYFGVTYNHWIADAYSMRMLLQCIVARFEGNTELLPTLTLNAPTFTSLFQQHLGKQPKILWLWEMLRSLKLFNRAYRLPLTNKLDFTSQHVLQSLSTDILTKLKSYCHKKNVRMNDLFVALLAKIMGEFSANDRYQKKSTRFCGKRDRIAISTIADIRHAANEPLTHVLGQYLSSYTLVLATPEKRSLDHIMEEVYQSTSQIKKRSHIVRSHYNFETALWLWDYKSSLKQRASLFHKHAPICAGISNVNIADGGLSKSHVLDYWRASPTGPLAPLVFSITTFRERLTVCLAYRSSAISDHFATILSESFCQKLVQLVE